MIKKTLLFTAFLAFSVICKAQTVTVGTPEVVMTPAQRPAMYWPDGNLHALFFNATNNLWATDGGSVNSRGVTSTAINSLLSNYMNISTSMNIPLGSSGAFDQDYAGGGPIYYDATDNILIQMYHGEFHYTPALNPSYAGLGLAYSNDQGVTWHKLGQVISPQTPRSGSCQVDTGVGTLVPVGLYLYSYYVDESATCNGGNFNVTVARALITDVISAAMAGTPFTSGAGTLFMKYTGSGTWTGNGVTDLANPAAGGGAFTALRTGNCTWVPSVAYNAAISKYVMAFANCWTGLAVAFSSDGLTWGSPTQIVSGGSTPPNAIFYPALLNTAGGGSNPEVLGSTFYVYYVDPFGDWTTTNLKRVSLSVPANPPNNPYISQSGTGSGTSCSDPLPVSFFNTATNWGTSSGQIGPGTTVHVCGTITTTLNFQGNGTSGSPIILLAESGAILTQPAGNLINLNGHSNLLLNGASTGTIQNTANGTNLANHVNAQAIQMSGASNVEIEGWTCQNIYVAVPPTAQPGLDDTLSNCMYSNGLSGNILIHNNVLHDAGWIINLGGLANGTVVQVYNNDIYHMDHGIVAGDGANSYTVYEYGNHFHDESNWDTSSNIYHHDPIHLYNGSGGPGSWGTDIYWIYSNLYDGNRGANFTSDIFFENASASEPQVHNFNDVHIQTPGVAMTNGFMAVGDGLALGSLQVMNTTFLCDPTVALQFGVRIIATSLTFKNNVISGCNNFLSIEAGSAGGSGIDFNIYANQGTGGNSRWNWESEGPTNTFSTWQSNCLSCDLHSSYQTTAGLSATGIPAMGSAVIGAGTNLTSLAIPALNMDTTAGNSRGSINRPTSGAWDVGAYAFGSAPPFPVPPTGLKVRVVN